MADGSEYMVDIGPYPVSIVLDVEVGELGAECATPTIASVLYEGSWHVVIVAKQITDATAVTLRIRKGANTREQEGIFINKKSHIILDAPLAAGDVLTAVIDTDNCKTQSCAVTVSKLENTAGDCELDAFTQEAGMLTGGMICVGKDLYRLVYDGEGGVYPGYLVQESCKPCGGINPNCDSDPEIPRYFYVKRCQTGNSYATETALPTNGQRVSHPTKGTLISEGRYTDTLVPPANNIGPVTIVEGQTGCTGSGGGTPPVVYYNLQHCFYGTIFQTTTPPEFANQMVTKDGPGLGQFFYITGYTTSPNNNIGEVHRLPDTFCGGGDPGHVTYYNIRNCQNRSEVFQAAAAYGPPEAENHRGWTPWGDHYWDGTTTTVVTTTLRTFIPQFYNGHVVFGCG